MNLFGDTKSSGFTLVELLVVIAIISLLSSVVLTSLSGARANARDSRRASDFDQLRKAVQAYITDNTAYPGLGDNAGVRVSRDCSMTNIYTDLVDAGYLQKMPTDPVDDPQTCGRNIDGDRLPEDGYFYGWDSSNPGGDNTVFCFGINRFEGGSVPEPLQDLNWQNDNDFGPDANLDEAAFVYCFTNTDSTFSPL
ncbi:MAG: hypothetical protein BRC25_02180 [Parcubacteria group bacterium SW_6_46_9]|nr:MAG: hypothetical protein BRC25_02180 [Parcubacteria group bacterium SW_6_46_9]